MHLIDLSVPAPPDVIAVAQAFIATGGSITDIADCAGTSSDEARVLLEHARSAGLLPYLCQQRGCFNHRRVRDVGCSLHTIPAHEWMSVADLRRHCLPLMGLGYTMREIERAGGLPVRTLARDGYVSRRLAHRTLQLTAEIMGTYRRDVPARGCVRRLQALLAAGHDLDVVASDLRLTTEQLVYLAVEEPQSVDVATASIVRGYYAAHSCDPIREPSEMAALMPWALPMDWEDIDAPRPALQAGRLATQQPPTPALRWANHVLKSEPAPTLSIRSRAKVLDIPNRKIPQIELLVSTFSAEESARAWKNFKKFMASYEAPTT